MIINTAVGDLLYNKTRCVDIDDLIIWVSTLAKVLARTEQVI